MKIEIYFLNLKLITEIEKDIKVCELLNDLTNYFKFKDSDFTLFDSNKIPLKNSQAIINKKNEINTFYLIKSNLQEKKDNSENIYKKSDINKLIMECTGAKKKLDKKENLALMYQRFNLFEIFQNRNNEIREHNNNAHFGSLLNLSQILDGNNELNSPQIHIDADEIYLKELQNMGFSKERARQALIHSRNDINKATEILLGEEDEEEEE